MRRLAKMIKLLNAYFDIIKDLLFQNADKLGWFYRAEPGQIADLTGRWMLISVIDFLGMRWLASKISNPKRRPFLSMSISTPSFTLRVFAMLPFWNWIYKASAFSSNVIFIELKFIIDRGSCQAIMGTKVDGVEMVRINK